MRTRLSVEVVELLHSANRWVVGNSPAEAETCFLQAVLIDSTPASALEFGSFLGEQGRHEEALPSLLQGWELAKSENSVQYRAIACLLLAKAHDRLKQLSLSRQFHQLAVAAAMECLSTSQEPEATCGWSIVNDIQSWERNIGSQRSQFDQTGVQNTASTPAPTLKILAELAELELRICQLCEKLRLDAAIEVLQEARSIACNARIDFKVSLYRSAASRLARVLAILSANPDCN